MIVLVAFAPLSRTTIDIEDPAFDIHPIQVDRQGNSRPAKTWLRQHHAATGVIVFLRPPCYIPLMNDESSSPERSRNIWAPWRAEYINGLGGPDDDCFLCCYRNDTSNDRKNLVLWRGETCMTALNRFPYTGGHCMVAPYEHVGDMEDLAPAALTEMMSMVRDLQRLLAEVVHAQGFNIGMNVGRCAGAGLPGHLHMHVVPRWAGDTNFIAVFGQVRVIPQSLESMYDAMVEASARLGLPRPPAKPE